MTPNPCVAITKSYFQRISNRPQTTHKPPQTLPQDPKISKPARAQTHPRESQRLWGKSRVGWGGSWCEALSFDSASGGPFGHFWGVLLRVFFFDFSSMFPYQNLLQKQKLQIPFGFKPRGFRFSLLFFCATTGSIHPRLMLDNLLGHFGVKT